MQTVTRLDALTSLRFFAAAMIVIGHADHIFGSFGLAQHLSLSQGVSFFFVLSGFILTYNYQTLSTKKEISRYLLARIARIWPLHLATALIWIALVFHFDRQTYFPGITGVIKLLSNMTLTQSWLPYVNWAISFNGVSWSISNEFYFYLMLPVLVAIPKKYLPVAFMTSALIALGFIITGQLLDLKASDSYEGAGLQGILYFNPLVRILEFVSGVCTAVLFRRYSLNPLVMSRTSWLAVEIGVIAIAVATLSTVGSSDFLQRLGTSFNYYMQREGLWPIWCALIFAFASSRGPIQKLLSIKPLVFLGEISFAIYLIHATILAVAPAHMTVVTLWKFGYIGFWMVLIVAASMLHIGIEEPFRKMMLAAWDKRNSSISDNFRSSYTPAALSCALLMMFAGVAVALRIGVQ